MIVKCYHRDMSKPLIAGNCRMAIASLERGFCFDCKVRGIVLLKFGMFPNSSVWWARRDSNPRPIGYEPTALTTELRALQHILMLGIVSDRSIYAYYIQF